MKTKYLLIILLMVFFGVSCTKNFEDFNTDHKNPTDVEGEYLVSQAQKELSDQISNTNVNWNVWKLFAQYWTETTYTDEANYDIINRNIPEQAFTAYYRNVLKPLDEAKKLISEDPIVGNETEQSKQNKLMIIELMEVYVYHNLVNIFGDVPYSEALDPDNISPAYEDAATIYGDLLTRLDNALSNLDGAEASFTEADLIYHGDVNAWIKFANSLKLKIAINLADANETKAQTAAEDAVTDGVFTSAADNALFAYMGSSPNTNPLHEDLVLSGRSDFVIANTIADIMNGLNDPRRDYYFSYPIEGEYVGGNYGESSAYAGYSHVSSWIEDPTFPGILLTYSEVQFYIAEAAARGWDVGQTAEAAYNEAVQASFDFWSAGDATDYLTNQAPYTGYADWKEAIGEQSYIAFYTRGLVAYTQYRRLDVPTMNEAPSAATGGPVPTRFTYPVNEQTLNKKNYEAASQAIGGDDLLTPLFWDTNQPD